MKLKQLSKNQKGQGLVEYLIIVAIVAIGSLGIMRVMGQSLTARFAEVTYALQGQKKKVQSEQVTESHTKVKDLGDFLDGSASKN